MMNDSTSSIRDTQSLNSRVLTMEDTVKDGELDPEALAKLQQQELNSRIVSWIQGEYTKCKNQLEPFKRQWYLNLSFYKGDQYVDFIQGRIIKVPAPKNRVRLTVNRIRPVVRTEMARLTSQEPTAEVVPASTDDEDILAASAAQATFESVRAEVKLQAKLTEAAFWTSVTGNGFLKTLWDKSFSETDPKGMAIEGKHEVTSVSPFHILIPDLLEQDIEKQPYVLNVFTKSIEWARQRYGDIIPEDKRPKVIGSQEILESQYLNTKGNTEHKPEPDCCLVIEAWIKPGTVAFLPKGGLVTLIDDIIVQCSMEGIPYEHGEYPFAHIVDIPSGSFYGTSVIEDLIPLQQEFNRNRSQQVEARNIMARPGMYYTEGSIDPDKVTNTPGQMIGVKPGAEYPQPIQMPNLPPYTQAEPEMLLRDIEDISGQHQVSKGNTPAGVTAGTAIQFLAEQDSSFMATTYQSLEEAVQKVAKQIISLFIQYVDSPRAIKYAGRDKSLSIKFLQGADIKSGTDVRIESGSSLPQSKAARIAMFTDWITRGILPPQDGLKLMRLPSMQSYWDIAEVDEIQAQRENLRMSELPVDEVTAVREEMEAEKQQMTMGMNPEADPIMAQQVEIFNEPIIPVNDFDKHEVHIEVHTRFMKGQEYEAMDEALKGEFEKHLQKHKDAQGQAVLQQMIQKGMEQEGDPMAEQQLEMMGQEGGGEGGNQFSGIEQEQPVDGQPAEQ